MRLGDLNAPHSDSMPKVVALLFYMPTPDWRAEYGGRTMFYRVPEGYQSRPWYRETVEIG